MYDGILRRRNADRMDIAALGSVLGGMKNREKTIFEKEIYK